MILQLSVNLSPTANRADTQYGVAHVNDVGKVPKWYAYPATVPFEVDDKTGGEAWIFIRTLSDRRVEHRRYFVECGGARLLCELKYIGLKRIGLTNSCLLKYIGTIPTPTGGACKLEYLGLVKK